MWQSLCQDKLLELIDEAQELMAPPVRVFWNRIKSTPQKWQLAPWGDEGGGFWVVALVGQTCIWYNDIEEGFNISRYAHIGCIGAYRCEQEDLAPCIGFYFQSFTEDLSSAPS